MNSAEVMPAPWVCGLVGPPQLQRSALAFTSREIGIHVYRLIYPRTGETFYIGRGKGDRCQEQKYLNWRCRRIA
jgi:hypothetical protein